MGLDRHGSCKPCHALRTTHIDNLENLSCLVMIRFAGTTVHKNEASALRLGRQNKKTQNADSEPDAMNAPDDVENAKDPGLPATREDLGFAPPDPADPAPQDRRA